jgi:hypothetical protein
VLEGGPGGGIGLHLAGVLRTPSWNEGFDGGAKLKTGGEGSADHNKAGEQGDGRIMRC